MKTIERAQAPSLTILMATYNGEKYIQDQIQSIQLQSVSNWNLILSDDGSTDQTVDVALNCSKNDGRIRVKVRNSSKKGAKNNFFQALSLVDSGYVMFCDQDDVWAQNKIELSMKKMRELEAAYGSAIPLLVFSDMKVVDSSLNTIHDSFQRSSNFDPNDVSFRRIVSLNCAAGCTILMNEKCLQLCKRNKTFSKIEMHDWWVMLVASAFGRIGYVDSPLLLYRQHGDNQVGANSFSPLDRASDLGFMTEQFVGTIVQADHFLCVYSDLLADSTIVRLQAYAKIYHSKSLIKNIYYMAKSGFWKKGARKLGQLAMLFRLARLNKSNAAIFSR